MENEVVSKNFIEQEIEKDLRELSTKYNELGIEYGMHKIPAGAEWISSYRTCKIYFAELWIGTEI